MSELSFCRGLTRAIYILCIEHLRMLCLSGDSNLGPPAPAGEHSMQRAIRTAYWVAIQDLSLCCYSSPPSRDGGSWLNVIRLRVAYAWRSDRMHVAAWELRIRSGSPLCRDLTRVIYILCIEHLRMLRLSRESNPGPPALQGNTLCKVPIKWRIELPFGISACAATVLSLMDPVVERWAIEWRANLESRKMNDWELLIQ